MNGMEEAATTILSLLRINRKKNIFHTMLLFFFPMGYRETNAIYFFYKNKKYKKLTLQTHIKDKEKKNSKIY